MGKRKRLVADARKEANKSSYFAKLNDIKIQHEARFNKIREID